MKRREFRMRICAAVGILFFGCVGSLCVAHERTGEIDTSTAEDPVIRYGRPERIANFQFADVSESSGLAASGVREGVFWTHNDSGDGPHLFAVGSDGKLVCRAVLDLPRPRDWEDMASFRWRGKPFLLVGDVGDNSRKRTECQLHFVAEPETLLQTPGDTERTPGGNRLELTVTKTIRFRYDRGPRDCESVCYDTQHEQVLLVSKNWSLRAEVYKIDLPAATWLTDGGDVRGGLPLPAGPEVLEAQFVGEIGVPGATAMDISADGRRIIVLSYGNAFEFCRRPDEDWRTAFSRPAREISMPPRRQGEAVCYGADGKSLYLTSEHSPSPLFRVKPVVE